MFKLNTMETIPIKNNSSLPLLFPALRVFDKEKSTEKPMLKISPEKRVLDE